MTITDDQKLRNVFKQDTIFGRLYKSKEGWCWVIVMRTAASNAEEEDVVYATSAPLQI